MADDITQISPEELDRQSAGPRVAAAESALRSADEVSLRTAGQRRINVIWEYTQAVIAIILTTGTMLVASILVLRGGDESATALLLLSNAFFMIVTAYFQRTNHTKVGGVAAAAAHDENHR